MPPVSSPLRIVRTSVGCLEKSSLPMVAEGARTNCSKLVTGATCGLAAEITDQHIECGSKDERLRNGQERRGIGGCRPGGPHAPRALLTPFLKVRDGGRERIEREGDIGLRVGDRDIVLALTLEDAALAQECMPITGFRGSTTTMRNGKPCRDRHRLLP
jgi:hypothetical protein